MLYEKVYNSIVEKSLICEGTTVICALSGGADSVCLTDIMWKLKDRLGITVECAHVNHNLRGEESDGDERFVTEFCKARGIKLYKTSVDVMSLSKGRSLEETARQARYDFFDSLTKDSNAVVATAHTQNDNIETFFINLARGSGAKGLCGIPQVRNKFIRPLLDIKRCEIIEHLKSQKLMFCVDSTNMQTDYLRNFIRHNIISEFEKREDIDIYKAVGRAIENIKRDEAALDTIAGGIDCFDKNELSKLPEAVLYRVVSKKLRSDFCITLDSLHFDSVKLLILKENGAKVQIRGNIFARIRNNELEFFEQKSKPQDIQKLNFGQNVFLESTVLIKKTKEIYSTLTKASINYGKIKGDLYVRTRRDGDVFYSARRKCTSSLKKLLSNDKILPEKRDSLLVICDKNGIVFVQGYGVDKRYSAKADDENIISIEIKDEKQGEKLC